MDRHVHLNKYAEQNFGGGIIERVPVSFESTDNKKSHTSQGHSIHLRPPTVQSRDEAGPKRRRMACDRVSQLQQVVSTYVQHLTQHVDERVYAEVMKAFPISGGEAGDPCPPTTQHMLGARAVRKLLASFGQCAHIPLFHFDIEDASAMEMENWVKLYSAAIRCSIRECPTNVVLLEWDIKSDTHPTVLHFDPVDQHQTFIWFSGGQHMATIAAYFAENNILGAASPSESISAEFVATGLMIVDEYCPRLMVVVLILWLCYRFGCAHPFQVIEALQCHLFFPGKSQIDLRRLFAWFRGLLKHVDSTEKFTEALHIQQAPGTVQCLRLLPGGGMCPELCTDGYTWCREHTPHFIQPVWASARSTSIARMWYLPEYLKDFFHGRVIRICAAGYFESRWNVSDWSCSFDMMDQQIRANCGEARAGLPVPKTATIRFVNFVERGLDRKYRLQSPMCEAILKQMSGRWNSLANVAVWLMELMAPEVPRDTPLNEVRNNFVLLLLTHAPLYQWRLSVITLNDHPCYIMVDVSWFDGASEFHAGIKSALRSRTPLIKTTIHVKLTKPEAVNWLTSLDPKIPLHVSVLAEHVEHAAMTVLPTLVRHNTVPPQPTVLPNTPVIEDQFNTYFSVLNSDTCGGRMVWQRDARSAWVDVALQRHFPGWVTEETEEDVTESTESTSTTELEATDFEWDKDDWGDPNPSSAATQPRPYVGDL